jgi:hypothetical protein
MHHRDEQVIFLRHSNYQSPFISMQSLINANYQASSDLYSEPKPIRFERWWYYFNDHPMIQRSL